VVLANGRVLPDRVTQFPFAILELPQMRRAKPVGKMHEIVSVHDRLLKPAARNRKFFLGNTQVGEEFLSEALRELAVEAFGERHALLTCDITRADLLRSVVNCASNPKLDESCIIMQIVNAIIDAIVLTVSPWGTLRRRLEAAVLDRVVVTALWVPLR